MNTDDLKVFVEAHRSGSLAHAARRLGLSAMTVSRRLVSLEQGIGARLLHRSTRSLSLTAEGEMLLPHAERILEEEDAAQALIRPATAGIAGTLRVTASPPFGRKVLLPLLPDILRRHPKLNIDIQLADGMLDLTGSGIDLAIRQAHLSDSTLVARRIAKSHRQLVAAPSYVAQYGLPTTIADLAAHQCLRLSGSRHWQFLRDGNLLRCPVGGRVSANTIDTLHEACIAGLGIAALADWNVAKDVKEGLLVQIALTDAASEPLDIWAVYPNRHGLTPRAKVMIDAITARFADVMSNDGGSIES